MSLNLITSLTINRIIMITKDIELTREKLGILKNINFENKWSKHAKTKTKENTDTMSLCRSLAQRYLHLMRKMTVTL